MAIFETIMILKTDIPFKQQVEITESFTDLIQSFSKKKKVNRNIIGEKRLAYPVSKSETGFYVMFTYEATDSDVITLETQLRITDEIIKFMSLKLDEEKITDELEDLDIDESEDLDTSEHTTKKPIDALTLIYGIE